MPLIIQNIVESKKVVRFLIQRRLDKQYKKAKNYILVGHFSHVNFKLREPKKDDVYYFRINRQRRAWGYLEGTTLKIFKIDNHQG